MVCENTDSIQDALTWTCENQDHMARTYQDLQVIWKEHVPNYKQIDNHAECQFSLTSTEGIKMGRLALT